MNSQTYSFAKTNIFFTDGACSGNPGPGGWAFIGFMRDLRRVVERGGHSEATTNNIMELESACQALEFCQRELLSDPNPIRIYMDSSYVLKGITEWLPGWKARNWIKADGKPVMNRSQWERLSLLVEKFSGRLQWAYVPGHSAIPGNERVDAIAVAYSKLYSIELFDGPLDAYDASIFQDLSVLIPPSGPMRKASSPKGPATYLSVVDGKLEKHATWTECESRVKGRSGARFKKVSSVEEELAILKSWGLK